MSLDLGKIDLDKVKDIAEDAAKELGKNKEAQKVFDQVAGEIEKKAKVDIPDAKDIAKTLGGSKK